MNEFDDLDQLERECGPALRVALRRVAAEISDDTSAWQPDSTVRYLNGEHTAFDEREAPTTSADDLPRERYPRRRWMLVAAATIIVFALGLLAWVADRDPDSVQTDTVPLTPAPSTNPATTTALLPAPTIPAKTPSASGEEITAFAAAIEASGVLTSPSVEEIALASDTNLYPPDIGSTQVSASDHFVSLRTCHTTRPSLNCTTGWAYLTGSVDGGVVHRGLLGEADAPEVYVLDDRFFVAIETSPGVQRSPTAWLIDSVSGGYAELTWRDETTTMSAREQALVVSEGQYSVPRVARMTGSVIRDEGELLLPRVVDARDGTIRPLAVPGNASANLPVTQNGKGRIWIGTAANGRELGEEDLDAVQVAGFAYSDDGGATWTEVTIPSELLATERLATKDSWGVSIAADGDRIAVTSAWSYNPDRYVYVSSDAGLSWSTVTIANPSSNNGAHLYVLADKRLLLVRSDDVYPAHLLVSTGSDWTRLEENLQATQSTRKKYVSVNRDGIVLMYFPVEVFDDGNIGGMADAPPIREHFGTDLINWRTIAVLDD